jgi:hypothetical protein
LTAGSVSHPSCGPALQLHQLCTDPGLAVQATLLVGQTEACLVSTMCVPGPQFIAESANPSLHLLLKIKPNKQSVARGCVASQCLNYLLLTFAYICHPVCNLEGVGAEQFICAAHSSPSLLAGVLAAACIVSLTSWSSQSKLG